MSTAGNKGVITDKRARTWAARSSYWLLYEKFTATDFRYPVLQPSLIGNAHTYQHI